MSNHLLDKATLARGSRSRQFQSSVAVWRVGHAMLKSPLRWHASALAVVRSRPVTPSAGLELSQFHRPAKLVDCTRSAETSAMVSELTEQVSDVEGSCLASNICLTSKNEQRPGGMAHSGRLYLPSPSAAAGHSGRWHPRHAEHADPFMCCHCNDVMRHRQAVSWRDAEWHRCLRRKRAWREILGSGRLISARNVATN